MRHRLQSSKHSSHHVSFISYPKYNSLPHWRDQISQSDDRTDCQSMTFEEWTRMPDEFQKAKISILVNHLAFLRELLKQDDAVNIRSPGNQSVLHLAVMKGDFAKVSLLLQHQAGVEAMNT